MGRKVREGEKSVKVKGYPARLFHISQTDIATPQERKDHFNKVQAQTAKREAKAGQQPSA